jgi:acetyl esterase/lipase
MDEHPHAYDDPGRLHTFTPWRDPSYRDVQYAIAEGYRPLLLDLTLPAERRHPAPVVVCIHGGAWITGSHKSTPDEPVDHQSIWDAFLARGLAVASVQYRHSAEAVFPAQLHDLKAAVRWLRRYGNELGLDPDRIGVWGESAGGHLAALLALNTSLPELEGDIGVTGVDSHVRAAVAWYPPTDLTSIQEQMPIGSTFRHDVPDSPESLLLGSTPASDPARAVQASPITYVGPGSAPILLVHGDRDDVVPYEQSASLHQRILQNGQVSTLLTAPGANHCFSGVDPLPYIEATADELQSRLAGS